MRGSRLESQGPLFGKAIAVSMAAVNICPQTESENLKKVLLPVLGLLFVALACGGAAWADISDPADLHVGTGAGTSCATGCGADPNTITSTAWDVFYNP